MDALSEVLSNEPHQNFEVPQLHLLISSKHDKKWCGQFRKYAEFLPRSQQVEMPKDMVMPQETVTWVKNQRTRRKANKLSEWKIKLLDKVGFIWVVNRTFDENLRDLESLSSRGEAITEPRLQYVQQRLARQLRENKPLRNGGKGRQIFSQNNILRFKQTAHDERKTAKGPDAVKDLEIHDEADGKEDDNNNSNLNGEHGPNNEEIEEDIENKIDAQNVGNCGHADAKDLPDETEESDENDAVSLSDPQKDLNVGELEIKQKQFGVPSNNGTDAINQDEDDERSNEVTVNDNGNQEKPINEDANDTGVEDELPKRHNKNEKDDKKPTPIVNDNMKETPENTLPTEGEVTDDVHKCLLPNPGNRIPCRRYTIKFDSDDEEQSQGENDEVQRELSNGCSDGFLPTGVFPNDPCVDNIVRNEGLSNEKKRRRKSLTLVDLVSSDDEENNRKKVTIRPPVEVDMTNSDDEVTFDDSATLPFGDQEYEAVVSLTNSKHSVTLGPTNWHGYYARFLKAHDPTSGIGFRSEGDVLKKIGTTNLLNLNFTSVVNILVRHKESNENPAIVACDSYLIRRKNTILVYPFLGGTEMEKIGNESLRSLPKMMTETQLSDDELLARQKQNCDLCSKGIRPFCIIYTSCLDTLRPGVWLNDAVVDIWMRW
jgi:hypothetical protein